MDAKPISEFHFGDEITGFYVLRRADLKRRRDNQGYYLAIDISDATGYISGNVWDEARKAGRGLTRGDIVKVQGTIQSYQGKKQVSIAKIRKVTDQDPIDMGQLVASVEGEVDGLWREFTRLADSVVNPFLRSLLRKFTEDEGFREAFCQAPGGKAGHHTYLGGLLEHTVAVTRACEKLAGIYDAVDRDLLIAASLLHDVGKLETYQPGPTFEYTDEGRLVGPAVLGVQTVMARAANISAFPEELGKQVRHLLLAQRAEFGQPPHTQPMTAEALLLCRANEMDVELNVWFRTRKREQRAGTRWSQYVRAMDRHFYFGDA